MEIGEGVGTSIVVEVTEDASGRVINVEAVFENKVVINADGVRFIEVQDGGRKA